MGSSVYCRHAQEIGTLPGVKMRIETKPSIGSPIWSMRMKEPLYAKELAMIAIDYGDFVTKFHDTFDSHSYESSVEIKMRAFISAFLHSLVCQRLICPESIRNLDINIEWSFHGMYRISYVSEATPPDVRWSM